MQTIINKKDRISKKDNLLFLVSGISDLDKKYFNGEEFKYMRTFQKNHDQKTFVFNRFGHWHFVHLASSERKANIRYEKFRKEGNTCLQLINKHKLNEITIISKYDAETLAAFAEGMALGNYQFLKYKSDKDKKLNTLNGIYLKTDIPDDKIEILNILTDAVTHCRNMVNEPVMYMNAEKLSKTISQMAQEAGAGAEVFNKKKIEALKMGGLLAVNKGSVDPPTFTVLEWKPEKAINEKPIVLVGKGVVYDTGGMNIKTGSFMNDMKLDMAGAATASSTLFAVAKASLPVHLIALIPATDNRVTGNAYVNGDIITMHDGSTVEVINTDAEGRMILADALSYAKKYDPQLVIDMATLTGSAARAIGHHGIVAMQKDAASFMKKLKDSGHKTAEEIAEFPFWDEYDELIKSEVADIKNLGGDYAGAIVAGKFLAHFTDYPFIHLDIAGPAFTNKPYKYFGNGGTAFGVRLLFNFIRSFVS